MYRDQQCLTKQFYKEQRKEGEEEADKKTTGGITSPSGQGWRFAMR